MLIRYRDADAMMMMMTMIMGGWGWLYNIVELIISRFDKAKRMIWDFLFYLNQIETKFSKFHMMLEESGRKKSSTAVCI